MNFIFPGFAIFVCLSINCYAEGSKSRCPKLEGTYLFLNNSCRYETPESASSDTAASAYYLPFPVGRMVHDSEFQIVQNGCADLQVNTRGKHLHAFNFDLTRTSSAAVIHEERESKTNSGNGYVTQSEGRFLILREKTLRVITSFYVESGWPPDLSNAWIKADCKFEKISD